MRSVNLVRTLFKLDLTETQRCDAYVMFSRYGMDKFLVWLGEDNRKIFLENIKEYESVECV